MTIKELKESEVTFEVECLPDECPIEGNALASGDDQADLEQELWVKTQLADGNEWAWCTVKVTARWGSFACSDYLGCCSYLGESDFRAPGGYFDAMKQETLARLNEEVGAAFAEMEGRTES